LRLPYGKRTGVAAVDRLNIVAHDKFQEIIDEANRGDSPIRLQRLILDAPDADERKTSVQVTAGLQERLGLAEPSMQPVSGADGRPAEAITPAFASEPERRVARMVMDVIGTYEVRSAEVPSSGALLNADVQRDIAAQVAERLKPMQASLLAEEDLDVAAVVAKTTELLIQQTIDIPRIAVVPTGEVSTGIDHFALDLTQLHLQPSEREIVIQNLRTNKQETMQAEQGVQERRPEDYIVHALVDYDDIDYVAHAELLYDLAGQMVKHLLGYLSGPEARNVLDGNRKLIAREIHAQMQAHFWERATAYEVQVSRGFTELRPCNYTVTAGQPAHHFRETLSEVGRIKQILFGGFSRCLYPLQKFDSDTERRFAVILERDALKWFKPAKRQFQIYYKLGTEQPEYVPDFVAEMDDANFMIETKARDDMTSTEVTAKAEAASRWCRHATEYATQLGSKPWRYLLIPHDEVSESKRWEDYLRFEVTD
ncbi:MAG TPA: type III restriction endonuclease subunit R, partial [Rhodanobacter sp.]